MKFETFVESLEKKIVDSYESPITMEDAETLAGEFLYAQLVVSNELRVVDLDARMKKSGVKAAKAECYLSEVSRNEKKPSDVLLEHMINQNKLVSDEQDALDIAEVKRSELERVYNVFLNAHIFYRGIAKGKLE